MTTDRKRDGFHRYGRFEVLREGVRVKNIEGREAYTKTLNWRDLQKIKSTYKLYST